MFDFEYKLETFFFSYSCCLFCTQYKAYLCLLFQTEHFKYSLFPGLRKLFLESLLFLRPSLELFFLRRSIILGLQIPISESLCSLSPHLLTWYMLSLRKDLFFYLNQFDYELSLSFFFCFSTLFLSFLRSSQFLMG